VAGPIKKHKASRREGKKIKGGKGTKLKKKKKTVDKVAKGG